MYNNFEMKDKIKQSLYKQLKSKTDNRVPIKRGCSNKGLCFCTGKCNEVIGYRDKIIGEN